MTTINLHFVVIHMLQVVRYSHGSPIDCVFINFYGPIFLKYEYWQKTRYNESFLLFSPTAPRALKQPSPGSHLRKVARGALLCARIRLARRIFSISTKEKYFVYEIFRAPERATSTFVSAIAKGDTITFTSKIIKFLPGKKVHSKRVILPHLKCPKGPPFPYAHPHNFTFVNTYRLFCIIYPSAKTRVIFFDVVAA